MQITDILAQMGGLQSIARELGVSESQVASGAQALDLVLLQNLSFEKPDEERFPCLRLAYQALRAGGRAPAVLNAANEVAVESFLAGRLAFTAIAQVIGEVLDVLGHGSAEDLAAVLAADAAARRAARGRVEARIGRAA